MATEASRRYYFAGPQKEYPTQNAAQRMAEWKQKKLREYWGDKFISSKLVWTNRSVHVEVEYRDN